MNNIEDKELFIKMAERHLYGIEVSEKLEDSMKYAIGLHDYIEEFLNIIISSKKKEEKTFKKFIKREVLG